MFTVMNDLPDNTIGISAEGKVTAQDYETVLMPAVEEKLKTHKKIRMIYQLSSAVTGFEFGAMMDDAKIGMQHMLAFEKVAVVSDQQVIDSIIKLFSHILPGRVRIFKNAELQEAKKWIAEE